LSGSIALYPYGQQTPTPSVAPDFVYELSAEMPTDGKSPFSVTGTLENPQDLSVGKLLKDFANDGTFGTGIADQLTIDRFDFTAQTEGGTGTVSEFSVEVAMSSAKTNGSYFGIFNTGLGVKNFSVAVQYQREDGGKK
jgi:hypothetical protein